MADIPPPVHDPDEANRTADRILDGAEYAPLEPTPLERAQDWFNEQIGRLFEALFDGGGGAIVGWLVLFAAVALVAVLALRVGRSVQTDPGIAGPVMTATTRTPDEWLVAAAAHEAAGRWKEGLRDRYRALIAALVGAGIVAEQAGRTTGEHRSDVTATRPDLAIEFAVAAGLFDRAWYGGMPTGAPEAERFATSASKVRTSLARRAERSEVATAGVVG